MSGNTEFDELRERVAAHRPSDIDAYGVTNPPEFFAVVTEAFFEKGAELKRNHHELYDDFYRQDPASDAPVPAIASGPAAPEAPA